MTTALIHAMNLGWILVGVLEVYQWTQSLLMWSLYPGGGDVCQMAKSALEKNKALNKDTRSQGEEDSQELREGVQLEVHSEGTSEKPKLPRQQLTFNLHQV